MVIHQLALIANLISRARALARAASLAFRLIERRETREERQLYSYAKHVSVCVVYWDLRLPIEAEMSNYDDANWRGVE